MEKKRFLVEKKIKKSSSMDVLTTCSVLLYIASMVYTLAGA